jgi:hypothetical protein
MISESYQQCMSESEDRTNDYTNISENYYFNIIELNAQDSVVKRGIHLTIGQVYYCDHLTIGWIAIQNIIWCC